MAATSVVSCTTSSGHRTGAEKGSGAPSVATRWWSNSAAQLGSEISDVHPDSAVARLHSSRRDYCGMLQQTVAARKALLPHGPASDPVLIDSLSAFVVELQKVAPPEVTADWQVLGKAMLTFIRAAGKAPRKAVLDAATVQKAGAAVAADAQNRCRVDLSAVTS